MFAQSPQLFMMSSLSEKGCHHRCDRHCASANLIGRGKYLPTNNYSSAGRPQSTSLLGKQRAEMGNKWAVCIWLRLRGASDGTSATQSNDMYLWKGHQGLWQAPCCHLRVTAESRHPRLSSGHRLNPQGQQPGYSDLLPDFALVLLSEKLVFCLLCVDV